MYPIAQEAKKSATAILPKDALMESGSRQPATMDAKTAAASLV